VKRPSLGALFLSFVPFAAMCFSVSAWDRIHPMLCGLPFNILWLISWIVLTPICMWGVYRLEAPREERPRKADPSNKDGKRLG
jgi:hypothetical protein